MRMEKVILSPEDRKVPKECWIAFLRFLERNDDFYQLVAIASLVEARLTQIKPPGVETFPVGHRSR